MADPSVYVSEPSLDEITVQTSTDARKQRIVFEQGETPRRKHCPFPTRKHTSTQKSPHRPLTHSQERTEKKEAEMVRKRFADAPIPMRPLESPEGSEKEHEAQEEVLDCASAPLVVLVFAVISLLLYLLFPRLAPWLAVK